MSKIAVQVEIEKETYEVGLAVSELIKCLLAKKSLPEIIVAELPRLQAAVDGISLVGAELSDDPGAFARALALPLSDVLSAVKAAK